MPQRIGTRPPPLWPGFDARTVRLMWVDLVSGTLRALRRFLRIFRFSCLHENNTSKFQFDLDVENVKTSPWLGKLSDHNLRGR